MPENDKPIDPFSKDRLDKIFKISANDSECLEADEGVCVEFKESFSLGFNEDYAKTLASYANADGGYIVFGIVDAQKRMRGLSNNNFKNKDPAKITNALREFLTPDIKWHKYLHTFRGRDFGLIYVEKAVTKPVIITKNGREVKEGDIYYRYPGQSLRIRYPELRQIIEEERLKRLVLLERQVKKIMEIGIENVAILDTNTGEVTGPKGSFLIDESTLPKINFIKEGEFSETEGTPTLRLIGDVQPIDPKQVQIVKTIIKPKAISTPEIVHAFLDQEDVLEPIEYIKRICFERSVYLPIYYFMRLANLSQGEIIQFINETQSPPDKKKALINRLNSDDKGLNVGQTVCFGRKKFKEMILSESVDSDIQNENIIDILIACRTLKRTEINEQYLYRLLKKWFDMYYSSNSSKLRDNIRRTICYIDKKINKEF